MAWYLIAYKTFKGGKKKEPLLKQTQLWLNDFWDNLIIYLQ